MYTGLAGLVLGTTFFVLLILPLYFWIIFDEMKGQHPVRRTVWLMIVPLCLIIAPITIGLSLIPMMFFVAVGEAFDRPKPIGKTVSDIKLEQFVSKNIWTKLLWLTLTLIYCLLLLIYFLQTVLRF